jgi:CubicO group peptidase (beta-lactamase class C family)
MIAGSAGLFTTVPDLLIFLEMMLRNGEYAGTRFFNEQTMRSIETNQTHVPGIYTGLGWELYQPRYMGRHCTQQTFGKTGFTGCVVAADRSKGIGFVLLSNYTYPYRKNDVSLINSVRSDIADIVFSLSVPA